MSWQLEEERLRIEKAEQEASARLITQLQEQEQREADYRLEQLQQLTAKDEDLARELAASINQVL